ncbi:MAG: archaellin/type IV pilin N-terminal domain-containing protein [Nitrososphaerales archaeon]
MNKANLRLKNSKKGITPVIATIILIAGTLVLALVVGAYTFGLFGSNVKTIQLTSATLYGGTLSATGAAACAGTATEQISLNNPGSSTGVSGVTISGGGAASGTTGLFTVGSACQAASASNAVSATGVTSLTIYVSYAVTSGNTYNYVINFVNGQSISGSLIAQ